MNKSGEVAGSDNNSRTAIYTNLDPAITSKWFFKNKAFMVCFTIGVLIAISGSIYFWWYHNIVVFGVLYTAGNIVSIASSCYFMGPFNQFQKMFACKRIIATALVFSMIVLTVIFAVVLETQFLTVVFIIIQSLALTWYSRDYIFIPRIQDGETVQ